jgi:hypothetical protein
LLCRRGSSSRLLVLLWLSRIFAETLIPIVRRVIPPGYKRRERWAGSLLGFPTMTWRVPPPPPFVIHSWSCYRHDGLTPRTPSTCTASACSP